jgi:hypothetical protein
MPGYLVIHPDRGTLSDVAGRLMFTDPKMEGSAAGVGLSTRVVAAFKRQATERTEWAEWAECYEDDDLVFARVNGAPLRPDRVLDRFHDLTQRTGLPKVRLHDLRHLAATITAGVSLALVSKDAATRHVRDHRRPLQAPHRGVGAGRRRLPQERPRRRSRGAGQRARGTRCDHTATTKL